MLLLSPRCRLENKLGGESHTVGGDRRSRYLTPGIFKKQGMRIFTPSELKVTFETICCASDWTDEDPGARRGPPETQQQPQAVFGCP